MPNLLRFTTNVQKSHRQTRRNLQLVCENRVLSVWVDLDVSLCRLQHPKFERAIRLVRLFFFCKLRSFSMPTKEIIWRSSVRRFKQLYLAKHWELRTNSYETFFLTISVTMLSKLYCLNHAVLKWDGIQRRQTYFPCGLSWHSLHNFLSI
jgi:hypothetical protein